MVSDRFDWYSCKTTWMFSKCLSWCDIIWSLLVKEKRGRVFLDQSIDSTSNEFDEKRTSSHLSIEQKEMKLPRLLVKSIHRFISKMRCWVTDVHCSFDSFTLFWFASWRSLSLSLKKDSMTMFIRWSVSYVPLSLSLLSLITFHFKNIFER